MTESLGAGDDRAGSAAISGPTVAVVVVRDGRLPAGADEVVAEAGGRVLIVGSGAGSSAGSSAGSGAGSGAGSSAGSSAGSGAGSGAGSSAGSSAGSGAGSGAREAASALASANRAWWSELPTGPALLARVLAPVLDHTTLVLLPASPDGRDLAPRLAAAMGRPLLAGSARCSVRDGRVEADLVRLDGRIVVPASCASPAVATLLPGARTPEPTGQPPELVELHLQEASGPANDPETVGLMEPDPATMDLAEAQRVIGGGAGLVRRDASDTEAQAVFALMAEVAAALGASAGATRVVTDAGWMSYERQIGTTGVAINPLIYVALGVSGASQHVGGLGAPAHTVSVNTDPSCPMTAMADLGLVTDAAALLVELAHRLGVPVPDELMAVRA